MSSLFLEDLKDFTEDEIKKHLSENYAGEKSGFEYGEPNDKEKSKLLLFLDEVSILIAYESVGSWGCDSNSWFLFKHKGTGKLFENSGSHCSCYGFEGQFEPEKTTIKYLKSDKFSFYCGGYDNNETENQKAVKDYLVAL